MSVPTNAANPVQDALTHWGVPWNTPTIELAEKYGMTRHPYLGSDVGVIQISDALVDLPGRMFPVFAAANKPRSEFPPDRFSVNVWTADDAERNIAVAADYFAAQLGRASVSRYANTLRCEWVAGSASIRLTVWPPELQTMKAYNPSHEREPRLVQACTVSLFPGFRLPLSTQEQAWVESASVVLAYPQGIAPRARTRAGSPAFLSAVAYARDSPAIPPGQVSISADGQALIISGDELLVVPVADVIRLTVSKLYPAKGPGGSWLDVVCADAAAENGETRFRIRSGSGPNDLDTDASLLGKLIEKPVEIGSAYPDA